MYNLKRIEYHNEHEGFFMRRRRFLRPLLLSVLSLLILLSLSWLPLGFRPPAALAHAFVIGSDPVDGSTINTAPSAVRIFFNVPISSASSASVYFGINNQFMNAGSSHVANNDPKELDTPLIAQLPDGSYTVRWTALSTTDGHATHGVIGFNIGYSTTGLPGQVILGPSTSNMLPQLNLQGLLAIAWEWLVMGALALWVGILVMEGVVLAGSKSEGGRDGGESGRRNTRDWEGQDEGVSSVAEAERSSIRERSESGGVENGQVGESSREGPSTTPTFTSTFMERVRKQALPLQWLCLAGLFAGEIINLVLRATLLTQAANNNGIDPATLRELIVDTTYGHLWLLRIALIGVAAAFLWWTTRSPGRGFGGNRNTASTRTGGQTRYTIAWITLSGLILLTFALSDDITQLAQAHISAAVLLWLFLVAQCVWIGGAAYLGFVALPLLPAMEPDQHSKALVTLLQRCTPLILGSSAVLLVSGLFLAETSLSSVQQLITDPFGRALLVKILLITLMLLLSGYALFILRPRLRRQVILLPVVDAELPARRTRQSALERSEGRLIQTMRSLSYLGAGVLLCAALMSFFAPPIVFPATNYISSTSNSSSAPSTTNTQEIQTKQVGDLKVSLQVTPARIDYDNTVIVTMNDSSGNPVTDAQVHISINMQMMDMGTAGTTIKGGNSTYIATFGKDEAFSMPGIWVLDLKILRPHQAPEQATFQVMVA
jgi:methionine-rich copper-binding protein CopC/putative copper export protein